VQLRDYVTPLHKAGKPVPRAVLTNGQWWVVFIDPSATLCGVGSGEEAASLVHVFESTKQVLTHCDQFAEDLAYSSLAAPVDAISPESIRFRLDPDQATGLSFGLRLVRA